MKKNQLPHNLKEEVLWVKAEQHWRAFSTVTVSPSEFYTYSQPANSQQAAGAHLPRLRELALRAAEKRQLV